MENFSPKKTFFGSNLTYLRKSKKLSQKDFAAAIDVKQARASAWEKEVSYPEVKLLLHIADFFEVNLNALFFTDLEKEKRDSSDPNFKIGNTTLAELEKKLEEWKKEFEDYKENHV